MSKEQGHSYFFLLDEARKFCEDEIRLFIMDLDWIKQFWTYVREQYKMDVTINNTLYDSDPILRFPCSVAETSSIFDISKGLISNTPTETEEASELFRRAANTVWTYCEKYLYTEILLQILISINGNTQAVLFLKDLGLAAAIQRSNIERSNAEYGNH